jgi:hypothetical protein
MMFLPPESIGTHGRAAERRGKVREEDIDGSWMTDIGGVLREEVRSANGLSSSIKGDALNGDTFP